MNPGLVWLIVWLSFCAMMFSLIAAGVNYDRVAVFVLRLLDAPVYPEARMVAALIYQEPELWKVDNYGMEHPKVGRVRIAITALSLEVEGAFGRWEPNSIERRIIWNAVQWYRHAYIKRRLIEAVRTA